jgi:hypothetical protein
MVFRHGLDTVVTRRDHPKIAEKLILVIAVALLFMSGVGISRH